MPEVRALGVRAFRKERTSVPKLSLRKKKMAESYSRTLVYAAATMLWIPKPAGF